MPFRLKSPSNLPSKSLIQYLDLYLDASAAVAQCLDFLNIEYYFHNINKLFSNRSHIYNTILNIPIQILFSHPNNSHLLQYLSKNMPSFSQKQHKKNSNQLWLLLGIGDVLKPRDYFWFKIERLTATC